LLSASPTPVASLKSRKTYYGIEAVSAMQARNRIEVV
jgi:hypothetical protein